MISFTKRNFLGNSPLEILFSDWVFRETKGYSDWESVINGEKQNYIGHRFLLESKFGTLTTLDNLVAVITLFFNDITYKSVGYDIFGLH